MKRRGGGIITEKPKSVGRYAAGLIILMPLIVTLLQLPVNADDNAASCVSDRWEISSKKLNETTWEYNPGGNRSITIVTLDWPPYIGRNLCCQGWVQQVTIVLLSRMGYRVISIFYPWSRSVYMAETGRAAILYPEYFIEPDAPSDVIEHTPRREHLSLSRKIPGGPVAFMKRKGDPDVYKGNLLNLKHEKIGVVRGYQNTPEFDSLMDQGYFAIDEAIDDIQNAMKLINGRINLLVGDPYVVRYAISHDRRISDDERQALLSNLEIIEPALSHNDLYYAISRHFPGWEELLAMLNREIELLTVSGELSGIIQATETDCDAGRTLFSKKALPDITH